MDLNCTPIWTDYINFVKSQKAASKIDESQKMEQLRKVYQRAVITPMNNLEGEIFLVNHVMKFRIFLMFFF